MPSSNRGYHLVRFSCQSQTLHIPQTTRPSFFYIFLAVTLYGVYKIALFYGVAADVPFIRSPDMLTPSYSYGNLLGAIETADLNADGLFDLVVSNHAIVGPSSNPSVLVFFNVGSGRPFENSTGIFCPEFNSIVVGDWNRDGKQDDLSLCTIYDTVDTYMSVNYSSNNYPYHYPYNFPPSSTYNQIYGQSLSLIKGRFNDDEFEDLALISPGTNTLRILLAYGDGSFIQQTYPTANHSISVVRINFNHDQIDDLAVLSCNQTVSVFLGTSFGIFDRNYLSFDTNVGYAGQCNLLFKAADLNQDNKDDLIIINGDTNYISVFLGANCDEQT